jgi:uncharacterized protein YukJ
LQELELATGSKANEHENMNFKQFKPLNLKPVGYENQGQTDKMREFISKLVETAETPADQFKQWLVGFDTKAINA